MKKILLLLALSLFIILSAHAQISFSEGARPAFSERLYFGGNLGLQFGDVTYIDISPIAGYMVTNDFSVGLGITYRYLKYTYIDYETHIYGGRLFARHNIHLAKLPLFLYTEFETLNLEYAKYINPTEYIITREWVPAWFVGGGLFQPIGNRSGFMIVAMYNIIYSTERSPYNSPWVIRIGFTL